MWDYEHSVKYIIIDAQVTLFILFYTWKRIKIFKFKMSFDFSKN